MVDINRSQTRSSEARCGVTDVNISHERERGGDTRSGGYNQRNRGGGAAEIHYQLHATYV